MAAAHLATLWLSLRRAAFSLRFRCRSGGGGFLLLLLLLCRACCPAIIHLTGAAISSFELSFHFWVTFRHGRQVEELVFRVLQRSTQQK